MVFFYGKSLNGINAWLSGRTNDDIPLHKEGGHLIPPEGKIISIGGNVLMDAAFYANFKELDTMAGPFNPVEWIETRMGIDPNDFRPHLKNKRIGIVNMNELPVKVYQFLKAELPNVEFVDITESIAKLRSIKSDEEIETVRAAAHCHDRVFSALPYMVRPDRIEGDVVKEFRRRFYDLSSAGQDSSRTVFAELTSAPDGRAAAKEPILYPGRSLCLGDRVNIRMNAICYNAYYAGEGRCCVLGDACDQTKKAWNAIVKAQDAAAGVLMPGKTIREAANAANNSLEADGFSRDASAFIYGVGTNAAQAPMLYGVGEDWTLEAGTTLIVAPRVYIDGQDDYCCMDTYLITKDGCERITASDRSLIELH